MTTNETIGHWYHGGQFEDGKPRYTYVYVTKHRKLAKSSASDPDHPIHYGNGKVYRLRPEFHNLVRDHFDGSGRKVILQTDLRKHGGALSVFKEDDE